MKPLHYILIAAIFLLSACASSQYASSDDGIYFNPNKQYTYPAAESSPAMAKTKHLNEKTQTVIATRMESPADKKQQVDTLYVTNENRTVEIDAEPDKTYLIVDESDSYARRLRMFEEDEYTPPTVNVNIDAGYGFPYSPYYYSWHRPWWGFNSYYYTPWYWGTSWAWYNYWDSWYYPGYYRPWYYGGYYGYYYPHHHHHHDYYHNYSSNTNYGRRLANAGTARRTSSVGSSRSSATNAASTTRYSTTTRTRPQIQRVAGSASPQSSGNTGSSVETRRRSSSSVNASPVSNSVNSSLQQDGNWQNTGTGNSTTVTSRRRSDTGTSTQNTTYTRSSTSTRTTNTTYNNSSTNSRRSTTTYSNNRSSQPSTNYNNSRSNSYSNSSSQVNSSSGGSRSSGSSSGSSGGTSRRR